MNRLEIVPLDLAEANDQVARWHRHHQPVIGHKFSLGVEEIACDGRALVGVAIVGRPVARMNDNGWTLEVTRVATNGCANACSALYGAAWRVAREMGYRRLITYTLKTEPGTSLKAAGWTSLYETKGGSWDTPSRRRVDKAPTGQKRLWEVKAI